MAILIDNLYINERTKERYFVSNGIRCTACDEDPDRIVMVEFNWSKKKNTGRRGSGIRVLCRECWDNIVEMGEITEWQLYKVVDEPPDFSKIYIPRNPQLEASRTIPSVFDVMEIEQMYGGETTDNTQLAGRSTALQMLKSDMQDTDTITYLKEKDKKLSVKEALNYLEMMKHEAQVATATGR